MKDEARECWRICNCRGMIFSGGAATSGVSGLSGSSPGTETRVMSDREVRDDSNRRGAGEDLRCGVSLTLDMLLSTV